MNAELKSKVEEIIKSFDITEAELKALVDLFIESAEKGLSNVSSSHDSMPMIPTYVTSVPTGKEKGVLLAADLGGTNFRVCSVTLNGDHNLLALIIFCFYIYACEFIF